MKGNGLAIFCILAIFCLGGWLITSSFDEKNKWEYRQISEVKRIGNLNQWKIVYKCHDNDFEKFCSVRVNKEYKVGDFYAY